MTLTFVWGMLLSLGVWGQSPFDLKEMTDKTYEVLFEDPVKGFEMARECEQMALALEDTQALALSFKHQGMARYFKGEYGEALAFYELSRPFFESLADTLGLWSFYNNSAVVYNELGEQSLALVYHMRGLELVQKAGLTKKVASSLLNLGNVRADLKDYEGALDSYREALKINQFIEYSAGISNCLAGISGVHTQEERYDSSLYYDRLNKPFLEKNGSVGDILSFQVNFATSFMSLDMMDSAKTYLDLAVSNWDLMDARTKVHWHNVQGAYLMQKGQFREAQRVFGKGIRLADEMGFRFQANWLRLDMARNHQNLKEYQAAFDSIYAYAEEQARMTQLSSEFFMENITDRFHAQKQQDSLKQLQLLTALEAEANAASFEASRSRLVLFLSLTAFLLIGMGALLMFVRYRNKQKQLREQAQRLEIEHRLLRSHMAPHFLYNSMNAIQHFIGENDTFQAEVYLAKFARLMRTNLNHTRLEQVSLEEELEALKNYIELEQLRFEGKFTFEIVVDEEVDREMTMVPPLLLQPHVENAILHGIRSLPGDGKIEIRVKETENTLSIAIQDNGIGRAASLAGKAGAETVHRSLALEIIEERLSGLNHALSREGFRQEIVDLKDVLGEGIGTRVTVYYPV